MKFLVIAALFALLILLLYSRLYPYIKALQKIFGAAKNIADTSPIAGEPFRGSTTKADKKLVRCVSCGIWIPSERAIGARSGSSVYCSRECLEKPSNGKGRKIAV